MSTPCAFERALQGVDGRNDSRPRLATTADERRSATGRLCDDTVSSVTKSSPASFACAHMRQRQSCGSSIGARQQLAGACCLDDVDGAIAPLLRTLGVERHEKMQTLAGIGVHGGEQRGIGDVEIRLIERDLCGVLRKCFLESVALDRAPVLRVEAFAPTETDS